MANFHKEKWFHNELQRHWTWGQEQLGDQEIIAVLYYGSANYNCEDENSDCDTWIVYFDKEYDPRTYLIKQENFGNETVWLADIRAFIYGLLNGDWPYISALCTQYKIINPKYEGLWHELYAKRDRLAYIDTENTRDKLRQTAVEKLQVLQSSPNDLRPKPLYHLKIQQLMYLHYLQRKPITQFFNNEEIAQQLLEIKHLNCSEHSQLLQIGEELLNTMFAQDLPQLSMPTRKAIVVETLQLMQKFEKLGK